MKTLHFKIMIHAPAEKVWETMLNDATYREWTAAFNKYGSYYEGDWSEGSEMRFLGPDEKGSLGGMVSRIAVNRPYEYISIEHLGIVVNGKDDTSSKEAMRWSPAYENYTFVQNEYGTELFIEVDTDDEYREEFEKMWPKALHALKELSEKKQ